MRSLSDAQGGEGRRVKAVDLCRIARPDPTVPFTIEARRQAIEVMDAHAQGDSKGSIGHVDPGRAKKKEEPGGLKLAHGAGGCVLLPGPPCPSSSSRKGQCIS